ncbi:MAG: hypothetical protein ACE5JP_04515 [Candidatus Bipolaricaulia bacterium]
MRKREGATIASKPVLLYSLHQPDLSLTAPIAISLEYDPDADQVVAYAYDLELFGYGETELAALSDLRRTVADLYLELQESQDHLTGEALAIWRYLSQVVQSTQKP